MNKNEQTATMYESIPVVAELNKVPGFNPLKLLHRIISPESGETMLQLDLRYKKLWFRLANPKGRIRLNALHITEQMAIYEAQIFLERTDENPIGSFTSSCTKEEAPGGQYIQAAQQAAMDEALSDAGFGIQFADVSMGAKGIHYGSRISLNGTSQERETVVLANTDMISTEETQPTATPARSSVSTFPTALEKNRTSQQEKLEQGSKLPIQEKKTVITTGLAKNKPTQSTRAESIPPLEVIEENGKSAISLPVDSQSSLESLPVNLENSFENHLVQSGTEPKTTEQPARIEEMPEKESLLVQTETAEKPGNTLPVSESKGKEMDTREAVKKTMALLSGQNTSSTTKDTSSENSGKEESQNLPADNSQISEEEKFPYTRETPVDEILKYMTLEDAEKVVVDVGVCKGKTIAEVAERHVSSLKFYVYGAYRGDNNILRAAARIMLDTLDIKKAE